MPAKHITISKKDLRKLINAELKKKMPAAVEKVLLQREKAELIWQQTPQYKEQQYQAALKRLEWYCN